MQISFVLDGIGLCDFLTKGTVLYKIAIQIATYDTPQVNSLYNGEFTIDRFVQNKNPTMMSHKCAEQQMQVESMPDMTLRPYLVVN